MSAARCGTPSGFSAHQRHGERPCPACYSAKQEYDKRWRSAPERARSSRLNARAEGRAKTRLASMYPTLYAALYAEEKARLEDEADS